MTSNLPRAAIIFALSLLVSGCAFFQSDRIHYVWNSTSNVRCENCSPLPPKSEFVGIALSGGGSRASVFSAAAMEVLAEKGLMDRATHISSVSGGGFAAVYYVLNKPKPCAEPARAGSSCTSDEFEHFKEAMRHNFMGAMTRRQFVKLNRFSSSTRRLSSLQDSLDDKIIHGASFGDLAASPILLVNGARYDDGRRFVFSNLEIPEAASVHEPYTDETLRSASFSLPGCTRATPKDFSLALAIAISAGFPPLLGPAALNMPATCDGAAEQYWHLGDGGILDNSGVETLEDVALHTGSAEAPIKHAFIFAIDAGRRTTPEAMMRQSNLKLWTSDPGRVVDIVGMRANAYRRVALKGAKANAKVTFHVVKIRYADAKVDHWPASCGDQVDNAEAISAHIASIKTSLSINDCNADLLELAARDVVERALERQRPALERAGFTW